MQPTNVSASARTQKNAAARRIEWRRDRGFIVTAGSASVKTESERLRQEHRHLPAVVRVRRTIEGRRDRAAARDASAREIFDPVGESLTRRAGHVVEDPGAIGR